MTIYIAARAKYRSLDVAKIQDKLKAMGHQIAYDWPADSSSVKKPYRDPENRKSNQAVQAKMLYAAAKADIFILLDDPGLRGAYIELGAFLTDCLSDHKNRKAFVVGPDSYQREFIFESPDYVIYVNTIDEVYKTL